MRYCNVIIGLLTSLAEMETLSIAIVSTQLSTPVQKFRMVTPVFVEVLTVPKARLGVTHFSPSGLVSTHLRARAKQLYLKKTQFRASKS